MKDMLVCLAPILFLAVGLSVRKYHQQARSLLVYIIIGLIAALYFLE
jgi:hypothetical protein